MDGLRRHSKLIDPLIEIYLRNHFITARKLARKLGELLYEFWSWDESERISIDVLSKEVSEIIFTNYIFKEKEKLVAFFILNLRLELLGILTVCDLWLEGTLLWASAHIHQIQLHGIFTFLKIKFDFILAK